MDLSRRFALPDEPAPLDMLDTREACIMYIGGGLLVLIIIIIILVLIFR